MELDNLEIEEGTDGDDSVLLEEGIHDLLSDDGSIMEESELVLEEPAGLEVEQNLPVVLIMPEADAEPEDEKSIEEAIKAETNWEKDSDHGKFLSYLNTKLSEIPPHSGQTTVGCEKAISYLKRLDREISKAIQGDEGGKIDENEAERLRDMIYGYIDQLEGAYDTLIGKKKKKKKAQLRVGKKVLARFNDGKNLQYFISVASADEEALLPVELDEPTDEQVQAFLAGEVALSKNASARITLVEDPFLHAITKILISSHVSHGRNIEDVYNKLNDKYKFTNREELCIQDLLMEKGLPFTKDLARIGEDVQSFDGNQIDADTKYFA